MKKGPEERNIIGDLTESQLKSFFEGFCKWEICLENKDIEDILKRKNGMDQIYSVKDPILKKEIHVLVESKYREDDLDVPKSKISEMVYSVKKKLEKVNNTASFQDTIHDNIREVKLGVLASRFSKYDHKDIMKKIERVPIVETARERNPPIVLTLFNYRFAKLAELSNLFEGIEYIYPAGIVDIGSFKEKSKVLSPYYLFSDLIIGEGIKKNGEKEKFIVSFEQPSPQSVSYLCSITRSLLQLEKGEECKLFFTEGEFSETPRYNNDYLKNEEKGQIKISILRAINLECNFDFKEVFE